MIGEIIFEESNIRQIHPKLRNAVAMFNIRFSEAYNYIDYLTIIENSQTKIQIGGNLNSIKSDFIKISRANAYIVLYNLIEATMVEIVKGLYKHLKAEITSTDNLINVLKVLLFESLKQAKKRDTSFFNENLNLDFQKLVIDICFNDANLDGFFSGNIDGKKVREFATKYGINLNLSEESRNGGRLLEIKRTRNDLAHGSTSFLEKGINKAEYLVTLTIEVGYFLKSVITSVDDFLSNEKYYKINT